jgi:DNA modification methylase
MRYDDGFARLYQGDALETLRELPAGAAQMCVTSPPYWGLRDYGTAAWDGGAADCDHAGEPFRTRANVNGNTGTGIDGKNAEGRQFYRDRCRKCGARRIDRQLGLEATPEAYVARMVDVFREVRRVLRDDGTLWLNIGDSYAGGGTIGRNDQGKRVSDGAMMDGWKSTPNMGTRAAVATCKPKDLVGIPWMLAFALRADGWYLRSDIIWSKPNPMPESVTDRPTKAHEYLFLLSKRERYYYNADAIREAHAEPWRGQGERDTPNKVDTSEVAGWALKTGKREYNPNGRNKRDVWTIATAPYPDAHFATFPPDLVRPCILAGSPDGGVVLEPFAGSGTTLQVAKELGRQAIGIELSGEYLPMIAERLDRVAIPMPLFAPAPILAEQGAFI